MPHGWRLGKVLVDRSDGYGSFADRAGNPFDRAMANIAGGEDARATGFEWIGLTLQRPAGTGDVPASQHEAVLVEAEDWVQPVGVRFGADQYEHRRSGHRLLLTLPVL